MSQNNWYILPYRVVENSRFRDKDNYTLNTKRLTNTF